MRQKIVNFVGKNNLLKLHALFSQRFHELHHIGKSHVAIVIALNQQHG